MEILASFQVLHGQFSQKVEGRSRFGGIVRAGPLKLNVVAAARACQGFSRRLYRGLGRVVLGIAAIVVRSRGRAAVRWCATIGVRIGDGNGLHGEEDDRTD